MPQVQDLSLLLICSPLFYEDATAAPPVLTIDRITNITSRYVGIIRFETSCCYPYQTLTHLARVSTFGLLFKGNTINIPNQSRPYHVRNRQQLYTIILRTHTTSRILSNMDPVKARINLLQLPLSYSGTAFVNTYLTGT